MNFDLTDDQQLLGDSLSRLLRAEYGFDQRRLHAAQADGWSRTIWRKFGELGLLGLPFTQDDGGFGCGPIETMVVMEAFGGALVIEPYLTSVVLAGSVIAASLPTPQRSALIAGIVDGSHIAAFAHSEADSGYDLTSVHTTATHTENGWRLDGTKCIVLHGDSADTIVVSARIADAAELPGELALFVMPASAAGITRHGYPTQDGMRAADIGLDGVLLPDDARLDVADPAGVVIEQAFEVTIAALCAEAIGAMQAALDLTVEYLKTREQFGRPLGTLQALQHQAADLFICLEQARSMTFYVTMMLATDDRYTRRRAVAAAKLLIGRLGRTLGQRAIQLHGGVGMTDEYSVSHYFKRLTMIDQMFGDFNHHEIALAEMGGLFEASTG